MRKHILQILSLLLLALSLANCGKSDQRKEAKEEEDAKAEAMLGGVWLDADENSVTFWVKGDTVFYPDSTNQPVAFKIIKDTMILYGGHTTKYPIVRQAAHLFEFKNQSGDIVKLIKSDNPADTLLFARRNAIALNQNKVIKSDTVVFYGDTKYHCYVQINPTTYKVYRSSFNYDGIEVESVYYDNTVHVSVFVGANKMFSRDFSKADFAKFVPKNLLSQNILSDIKLTHADDAGIHYQTFLAILDSPSSFIVELTISYNGKVSMGVAK